MPKKAKKQVRRTKVPLPDGMSFGDLIMYYDCGWRAGYLMEVRGAGHEVGIKPIAGYKKSAHNLNWYKISDIKPVEGNNGTIERSSRKKIRKARSKGKGIKHS